MKNFFKNNWFKIGLLIIILVSVLAMGILVYIIQVNKQESIEKQQIIKLQSDEAQVKKEYVASQKKACLEIYQAEIKKWTNVNDWNYNELTDKCVITYKETSPKTKAQCEEALEKLKEIYKDEPVPTVGFSTYLHCIDGTFTKEF